MKPPQSRSCELCGGDAALYCDADAAFLCWACDRRVHSANFLAAHHLRHLACSACGDTAISISGPGSDPISPLCSSCDSDPTPSTSAACSSVVSTADSDAPPPPAAASRSAGVRVLEGWGKSMGLRRGRRCADVAARVMGACEGGGGMGVAPLRAAMAAAMWFAARICGCACGGEMLGRLERCSGVPAKVIVFHEARLARAVERRRWRRQRGAARLEEGWGECSGAF